MAFILKFSETPSGSGEEEGTCRETCSPSSEENNLPSVGDPNHLCNKREGIPCCSLWQKHQFVEAPKGRIPAAVHRVPDAVCVMKGSLSLTRPLPYFPLPEDGWQLDQCCPLHKSPIGSRPDGRETWIQSLLVCSGNLWLSCCCKISEQSFWTTGTETFAMPRESPRVPGIDVFLC